MGTQARTRHDMDLLKDITRELRGGEHASSGGGSHGDAQSQTTSTTRSDSGRRRTDDETSDATAGPGESADGVGDIHVCSFCETEFDASSDVCPECDAEIVLRGDR